MGWGVSPAPYYGLSWAAGGLSRSMSLCSLGGENWVIWYLSHIAPITCLARASPSFHCLQKHPGKLAGSHNELPGVLGDEDIP